MPVDQSYYLDLGSGTDNVSRQDKALIPNCTGLCVLPSPFIGRSATGREDFYLQYLVRGEMDVWIDEEKKTMYPGQVILYYPHTAYHYTMRGAEDPGRDLLSPAGQKQEVQYYWVHFTGAEAASIVARCGVPNQTFISVSDSLGLQVEYEALFQDFIRRDALFEMSAAARITSLLVTIGRQARGNMQAEDDPRIQDALLAIHQRFREDLSVDDLARQSHLSTSRFRTLFRQRTGVSPKEYLTSLRLSRARMLLEQTDEPLSQIAEAVGYPDQLYFSRLFRSRIGLSPSEYRRTLSPG
ncbi:MAG: helix-turn-helix transcriptional regulator [Firmicutes bacterium]|nr:helix-turn-helix transcriptional regulator [Bacillota bacterium]